MKNVFSYPKAVLVEIKNFLEDRLRDTKKRMSILQSQDPFHDTDRLNDNASLDTEAYEQSNHERVQALKKELELKMERINKALTKIENGKYGFCDHCGKMIDIARLEAFPMADLCLSCEQKKEK